MGVGISSPRSLPWVDISDPRSFLRGVGMAGGTIQGRRRYLPPVRTPSGGHQNRYSWQAGDTHPTGMLSCCLDKFRFVV